MICYGARCVMSLFYYAKRGICPCAHAFAYTLLTLYAQRVPPRLYHDVYAVHAIRCCALRRACRLILLDIIAYDAQRRLRKAIRCCFSLFLAGRATAR